MQGIRPPRLSIPDPEPRATDGGRRRRRPAVWLVPILVAVVAFAGLAGLARIARPDPTPAAERAAEADRERERLPGATIDGPAWMTDRARSRPALPLAARQAGGTPVAIATGDATPGATPAGTPLPATPVPEATEAPLDTTCDAPLREGPRATPDPDAPTPIPEGPLSDLLGDDDDATPDAGTPAVALTRAGIPAGPADPETARDIERIARILGSCSQDGDADGVAAVTTDTFRGFLLGTVEPLPRETFLDLAEATPLAPITIRAVSEIEIRENGDATAAVEYVAGNQLLAGTWTFTLVVQGEPVGEDVELAPENARWALAGAEVEPPVVPDGAVTVDIELDEYEIAVEPDTIDGDTAVLEVANEGEAAHEVLVLRLEGDATPADILAQTGPALPEGITVAGQVPVAPGDEATMVLVDLEPGTYALVDLFPDPTGVPNLALGMEATLTVEE